MSCQTPYDICVPQFASFKLPLQFTSENNEAIDITTWIFSGSIKEKYKSTTAIAEFNIEEVNRVSGSINLYLTPAQTAVFIKTQYVYDIIAEVSGSSPPETVRLMEGVVAVGPGVTDGQTF